MLRFVGTPMADSDPRYESIHQFKDIIDKTWLTPLRPTSCLSREQRKCVRNVIRDYMSGAPTRPLEYSHLDPSFNAQWFDKRKIFDNPYYAALIKNSNYALYNLWYNNLSGSYSVDTFGKYVLYATFSILHAGFFVQPFAFDDVSLTRITESDLTQKMTSTFAEYIKHCAYMNYQNDCPFMFIGLPMYWINKYLDMDQIYFYVGSNVKTQILPTMARAYGAFVDYVRELDSAQLGLTFSYLGVSTSFYKSVPEFVMEALCYSAADEITKTNDCLALIYVSYTSGTRDTNRLFYYELDPKFRGTVTIPKVLHIPFDNYRDVSAVYIEQSTGIDEDDDLYFRLYKLITPDECGMQIVGSQTVNDRPDSFYVHVQLNKPYIPLPPATGPSAPPSVPPSVPPSLPPSVPPLPPSPEKFPEIEPLLPEPGDDIDTIISITKLDAVRAQLSTIRLAIATVSAIASSCERTYLRLAKHMETMRVCALLLAAKTDIQSFQESMRARAVHGNVSKPELEKPGSGAGSVDVVNIEVDNVESVPINVDRVEIEEVPAPAGSSDKTDPTYRPKSSVRGTLRSVKRATV